MRLDPYCDPYWAYLYISNSLDNEVRKYSLHGETPKRIGIIGTGELEFPRGLALNGAGDLFVVDSRHLRICVFNDKAEMIRSFGAPGREPGSFLYPWGIAIEPKSGLVFISDPQNNRIQVFTQEGKPISWWNTFTPVKLEAKPGSAKAPGPIRRGGGASRKTHRELRPGLRREGIPLRLHRFLHLEVPGQEMTGP